MNGMSDIGVATQLTTTGMGVVFAGLIILFVVMILFKWVDQVITNFGSRQEMQEPVADVVRNGISPEEVAVISAAVAVAIGKKTHIKRIRYRTSPTETSWSRQGRITIMGSHITK